MEGLGEAGGDVTGEGAHEDEEEQAGGGPRWHPTGDHARVRSFCSVAEPFLNFGRGGVGRNLSATDGNTSKMRPNRFARHVPGIESA